MKKKTLIILLIIPLIIGLISFVSVSILVNTVPIDIDGIAWDYDSQVGFKISDQTYLLKASPVILDDTKIIDDGNNLIWYATQDDEYVEITNTGDSYYLKANKEGRCTITCSNEKKTVGKSFTAIIYENSAVIINTEIPKASASNITNVAYFNDDNYVYGLYDYQDSKLNGSKVLSSLKLNIEVLSDTQDKTLSVSSYSSNIEYDESSSTIKFKQAGESYIEFHASNAYETYNFNIIDNSVNIYSYDDLLRATNKSENGDKIVLRTNLLSLDSLYTYNEVDLGGKTLAKIFNEAYNLNVNEKIDKLFGHFDFNNQSFTFENEIYTYESTYLTDYIDQLNQDSTYLSKYEKIDKTLKVGIHLQNDIYGNGYTISLHNLTFPRYAKMYSNYGYDGRLKPFDTSSDSSKSYQYQGKDLFTGPNYFLSIGDFHDTNFIAAYGEDNSAFLVDKDNITIKDIAIYGCDQVDNLYDYTYVGSTINILADNVSIKNSIISNGKNVIRAFSADNLSIDNCAISRAGEFLLLLGSNEYEKTSDDKQVSFNYGDTNVSGKLGDLKNNEIDMYLSKYLGLDGDTVSGMFNTSDIKNVPGLSNDKYIEFLKDLQESVYDYLYEDSEKIDCNVYINDTYFQDSGMYSIALETNFNGPYLYNGGPTPISSTFGSMFNIKAPDNISGTSKGVNLVLTGETSFYDYKDIDTIDMNTLIEDNLSALLGSLTSSVDTSNINIDTFFPVKPLIKDTCKDSIYKVEKESTTTDSSGNTTSTTSTLNYLNTKIIYYGGGVNNSKVSDLTNYKDLSSSQTNLDLVKAFTNKTYSNVSDSSAINSIASILAKCVLMVTGSHDFKTIVNSKVSNNQKPVDFDLNYDVNTIRNNYK